VQELLFDTPWWVLAIIVMVGAALFMSGNARQHKPTLRAGMGVILLGIVLGLVSYLVDTPREKVIKGTHKMVDAAVARDSTALGNYLHPNASLGGWNRQQIISGAVALADQFGLKSATITGMEVKQDGPGIITVTMRVMARFQNQNTPYETAPTDWQLQWWQTSDGKWLLKSVDPLGGGNLSGQQMSKQFFH